VADELWVFLSKRRVARVEHDKNRFTLCYEASDGPALSVRLPPREAPYDDAECRSFFTNLLPEGGWRQALCRQLGVAPDDDFGLLRAIGTDCAGAVVLSPDREFEPERGRYRKTTEAELAKWVKDPAKRPRPELSPGLRLSLAGSQDKLLIHLDGKNAYLCEAGAPSTVILKPDIRDPMNQIELSALNELLSMRLAAHAGLAVPRVFWFASAFAVERFDRRSAHPSIERLHQEDFVQVLGRSPTEKYSVSWAECFDLATRYATTPATTRLELVDRLLFSVLLGNNDAHGKNFAFLHDRAGSVRLAPAYDLLSTRAYPSLSTDFAMPIGKAKHLAELDLAAWKTFAKESKVSVPLLRTRAAALVERVTPALDAVLPELEGENPDLRRAIYPARRRMELASAIARTVKQHAKRVIRSFAG
jgi:serine/threonine-protein kinase HipA